MKKTLNLLMTIFLISVFLCSCGDTKSSEPTNTPTITQVPTATYNSDTFSCSYDASLIRLIEKPENNSAFFTSKNNPENSSYVLIMKNESKTPLKLTSEEVAETFFNSVFSINHNENTAINCASENIYSFYTDFDNNFYYGKILGYTDTSYTVSCCYISPNTSPEIKNALLHTYNSTKFISLPTSTPYNPNTNEIESNAEELAKTFKEIKDGKLYEKIKNIYSDFSHFGYFENGSYSITLSSDQNKKEAYTKLFNACENIIKKVYHKKKTCTFSLEIKRSCMATLTVIYNKDEKTLTSYLVPLKNKRIINKAYANNAYFKKIDHETRSQNKLDKIMNKYLN